MIRDLGWFPNFRSRYPVSADIVINDGDLVYFDGTTLRSLSAFTYDTSDAITRIKMKAQFAGQVIGAHRAGESLTTMEVLEMCYADADMISGTPAFGTLVSADFNATPLFESQKLEIVKDPMEAIGMVVQVPGGAVTKCRVVLWGTLSGAFTRNIARTETKIIRFDDLNGAADILDPVEVYKLFGGAIELLALGFIVDTPIATNDLVLQCEKDTVAMTTELTVPTAGSALGDYVEASYQADAARVFTPKQTFGIAVKATAPTGGTGNLVIRYRPLS